MPIDPKTPPAPGFARRVSEHHDEAAHASTVASGPDLLADSELDAVVARGLGGTLGGGGAGRNLLPGTERDLPGGLSPKGALGRLDRA